MSGWGRDYDDEPSLTLSDIERSLSDEDRATFAGLLLKGMKALEESEGGLVAQLREEIRDLKHRVRSYSGDLARTQGDLSSVRVEADRFKRLLLEKQAVLELSDEMRAEALIAENKQLRDRVEIQRQIIGRLEAGQNKDAASAWHLFKAGVRSAFVDPLSAIAEFKQGV